MLDVLVLGGGLAGAAVAARASQMGYSVSLLDRRHPYPDSFKAEKLEADQSALLRRLGLYGPIAQAAVPIAEVWDAKHGRIFRRSSTEQLGLAYHDMVNCARGALPPGVLRIARVKRLIPDPGAPSVELESGERLSARLVVVTTGTADKLLLPHGVVQLPIAADPFSLAIGFNIEPVSKGHFRFESLAYYPDGTASRIAYLSLFPNPKSMRANLFTYHEPKEQWVHEFAQNPDATLRKVFPLLTRVTGEFRVCGRPHICPIHLYRVAEPRLPGVVLLGDALQSVCPTTGTGLSKVLTDVSVLCERYLANWLTLPTRGLEVIAPFYADAEKDTVDHNSSARALYRRQVSLDSSLRWRLHRFRAYSGMWASGRVQSVRNLTH